MYYYNYSELYHHGIRGQKWGVRRFQNHDGTYTSAGKRRRNSENHGASPPRAKSGVGKKIATGLAIGAAAGLAAYGLSKVDTRKISDAIWMRKMTSPSLPKLREFTVSPKVKDFVKNNGNKALGVLKDSAKRSGKAMAEAAIASIGAIAVTKITSKISSKVNTGNADLDKVIKDTTSAGVNAAFNAKSYSSGNKYKSGPIDRAKGAEISKIVGPPKQKEIDRSGPEYQALFKNQNGEQRDPDTRGLIKSMASAGYGVDQISTYLDKLDKGEIRHSMFSSELYHHGVKGMKWGVRRYRNYDGSYTKRGLDHYRRTEADYENANTMYKAAKTAYKQTKKYGSATINGNRVAVTKNVVKEAKAERKRQKDRLNKNYDQLKRDYQGDKGKELYRKGKTITGNAMKIQMAGLVAAGTGLVAKTLRDKGNVKYSNYAMAAGVGVDAVIAALMVKGAVEAKHLRAYYGHSGKYA